MQAQDISLCQRPHFATTHVKRLTFSTPSTKATGAEALANRVLQKTILSHSKFSYELEVNKGEKT